MKTPLVVLAAVLVSAGTSAASVRDSSISVSESISAASVPPGGSATISFSATNNGADQSPFSLVLFLGPGDWSVGSAGSGCSRPDQYDVDCELPMLAAGASFSSSVTVTLGPSVTPGDILNSRVVAFPGGTGGAGLGGDARSIQVAQPTTGGGGGSPPAPAASPSTSILTVDMTGPGAVASAPAGIDCGTTCTAPFTNGTAVTLTATPSDGAQFAGWSGACAAAGTATQCSVTVSAATTVGASFAAAPPPTTTTTASPPVVCAVPHLLGVKLAAAKLRLAHSHCRLGTVTKRKSRAGLVGKIVAQHPAAGNYLAEGAKVALVLGRR
jgi:Divergent InlB B-repeat domain